MAQINNLIGSERQTRTLTSREYTVGIMMTEIPSALEPSLKTEYAINNCGLAYGDSHPAHPEAKLSRINAVARSNDVVELELTYVHYFKDVIINISTAMYQVETNKSIESSSLNGPDDLIKVSYKYPDTYELDDKLQGTIQHKSPTVPKDSHDAILTITREEEIDYVTALDLIDIYANTLNDSGWTVHPAAAAGIYKCIDINAEYNESGTYTMNYVFARRKGGWGVDLYYRDERTGEPPADVLEYASLESDGTPSPSPGGVRTGVPIYPVKNFNQLITI